MAISWLHLFVWDRMAQIGSFTAKHKNEQHNSLVRFEDHCFSVNFLVIQWFTTTCDFCWPNQFNIVSSLARIKICCAEANVGRGLSCRSCETETACTSRMSIDGGVRGRSVVQQRFFYCIGEDDDDDDDDDDAIDRLGEALWRTRLKRLGSEWSGRADGHKGKDG